MTSIGVIFRDGCTTLARNACDALLLAGREVTVPALLGIIDSLPHDREMLQNEEWQRRDCFQILLRGEERCRGTADEKRWREVWEYFFNDVPERGYDMWLLIAAFIGVQEGIYAACGPMFVAGHAPNARWFEPLRN